MGKLKKVNMKNTDSSSFQVSNDVKEIIDEIKEFQLEENINNTTRELVNFNKNFSQKILTIDERVILLHKLNTMREFSGWLLGDLLYKEEQKIKKEVSEWKNGTRVNKPEFMTLYDFIVKYENKLGFGKTTAYDYIKIRKRADLKTFLKLGIRKTIQILKIKDENISHKITQQAIKHNWTNDKIREKIADCISQDKKDAADNNLKNNGKKSKIDIHLNTNEIIIAFKNNQERDIFNEELQKILPTIQKNILK